MSAFPPTVAPRNVVSKNAPTCFKSPFPSKSLYEVSQFRGHNHFCCCGDPDTLQFVFYCSTKIEKVQCTSPGACPLNSDRRTALPPLCVRHTCLYRMRRLSMLTQFGGGCAPDFTSSLHLGPCRVFLEFTLLFTKKFMKILSFPLDGLEIIAERALSSGNAVSYRSPPLTTGQTCVTFCDLSPNYPGVWNVIIFICTLFLFGVT